MKKAKQLKEGDEEFEEGGSTDRIHYSISTKIDLGNWENVSVTYGYSSDRRPGETLLEHQGRITSHVETFISGKEEAIRDAKD